MRLLFIVLYLKWTLANNDWINKLDEAFTFSCPNGQAINSIISEHNNNAEDRRFKFQCANTPVSTESRNCQWTAFVNNFDAPFNYHCESNGYIAGIASYHDNGKEDRRFQFFCCTSPNVMVHGCQSSDYMNNFDELFSWRVGANNVLAGIASLHDDNKEDRRFSFTECEMITS